MIYLHRYIQPTADDDEPTIEIAICESRARVARYLERGYRVCTREAFLDDWRWRDEQRLRTIVPRPAAAAAETAPLGSGTGLPRQRVGWG